MTMKILTSLGLAAAVAVVSTTAFASDLPNKKKAPTTIVAPRAFSWNGVYAGLNGGLVNTNSYGSGSSVVGDASGGIFGLTAGYNAQMPNNVVVGVEGDSGMTNADDKTANGSTKIESLSTVRARAGLAMDRLLPFVTAGYAGSSVKLANTTDSNTKYLNGWTAGAGAEYAFSDNLSAKAEALYVSLDKANVPGGTKAGYDGGVYRVGLNYHF
jgi:outer membrane immunogenic protein